jgi:predicted ATPase
MDILDLVALMQKYAEENPKILEFKIIKSKDPKSKGAIFYDLKVKKIGFKQYYFRVVDTYKNQQIGKIYFNYFHVINKRLTTGATSHEQILQYLNNWISDIKVIINAYLDNINIKNFFCIKEEIEFNNLQNKKEIYFLGENGDGKTLLLQAILMILKYHFIQNTDTKKEETYVGKILDIINESDLTLTATDSYLNRYSIEKSAYLHEKSDNPKFIDSIFAYGVHRSRSNVSKKAELYGFGTLFSDDVYLRSPTEWLKDVERLDLKRISKGISLSNAISILEDLLDKNVKIRIEEDVIFEERGFPVKFDALSEGYKSVMTWVADLVSRLADNQPEVKPIKVNGKMTFPYHGIVLVDEISLHLHPKWEYELVRKLRGWFPNIQFIMTTHSPVTVLGASEDAIFFKVYKEKGVTKVRPYEELQVGNMRADQILTSEFFGLEPTRPAYLQKYMNLRKEILTKTELTKEDEEKLKTWEDKYGTLPTGETKEELKTKMLLNEVLNHLKANDKN